MAEPVKNIIEIGSSVLLWLGGGSVVTVAVSAFASKFMVDRSLEKHKSKLATELERLKGDLAKEVETHKLSLRRTEILFERQIDACNNFIALHENLKPTFRPGMDSYDAVVEFSGRLGIAEDLLRTFKLQHSSIIDEQVCTLLEEAIVLADEHKFDEIMQSQSSKFHYFEPSDDTLNAGGEVMKKMSNIEQALIEKIKEK